MNVPVQFRLASVWMFTTGAVLVSGACSSGTPPTPAASAPSLVPRTSINAMMVTMVDNAGHVLWDAERPEFAPKDDADWLELQDHAIQVAAASTLIQLGGTGQADMGWIKQVGWDTHANAMGDAALGALEAAKAKDLPALVKANGALVETCEGCHKAFKPALPSEGIAHQRPHSESHR